MPVPFTPSCDTQSCGRDFRAGGCPRAAPHVQEPPVQEAAPSERRRYAAPCQASGGLDVVDGDLAGATVRLGVEAHLLAFAKSAHAGALERGCMNEHVLATAVGLDETIALLLIVEFDSAAFH